MVKNHVRTRQRPEHMDPAGPTTPPAQCIDWASVTVIGRDMEVTIITVYLRPSQTHDHATTFAQVKAYIADANVLYVIFVDFNHSPHMQRPTRSGMHQNACMLSQVCPCAKAP